MARYMEEQPDARIALEVANTQEIARKVEQFELDIGLIEGELQHPELEIIPWCEDELVVFCSPNHPFAEKKQLDDNDLRAAKWIIRESGSGTRQTFDRGMVGLLPELDVLLELQHTEAIKQAVTANLGIGCLSKITVKDAFARGDLIPLVVDNRSFQRRFYFIVHQQKFMTAGISHWMSLCKDTV